MLYNISVSTNGYVLSHPVIKSQNIILEPYPFHVSQLLKITWSLFKLRKPVSKYGIHTLVPTSLQLAFLQFNWVKLIIFYHHSLKMVLDKSKWPSFCRSWNDSWEVNQSRRIWLTSHGISSNNQIIPRSIFNSMTFILHGYDTISINQK